MKSFALKLALAAVLCAGFAVTANAAGACGVTFKPEVYERWPHADDACMEIVTRDDGNQYAKFEAEVVSQSPSGTYVRWHKADGSRGPSVKVNPPEGFVAHIGGQAVEVADMNPRQKMNVYLPATSWVDPNATAEDLAAAEAAAAAAATASAAAEQEAAAEEEVAEEEAAPAMPTTAGNLGWLALFGALFLVLGGALRFARQS